jgi:hypothetical protein
MLANAARRKCGPSPGLSMLSILDKSSLILFSKRPRFLSAIFQIWLIHLSFDDRERSFHSSLDGGLTSHFKQTNS